MRARWAAKAAGEAAQGDPGRTPRARRMTRGTAVQRWRGLAPRRRGTGWSKTGSPRCWDLNLARKKRERVTGAFTDCQPYAQLHARDQRAELEGGNVFPNPRPRME